MLRVRGTVMSIVNVTLRGQSHVPWLHRKPISIGSCPPKSFRPEDEFFLHRKNLQVCVGDIQSVWQLVTSVPEPHLVIEGKGLWNCSDNVQRAESQPCNLQRANGETGREGLPAEIAMSTWSLPKWLGNDTRKIITGTVGIALVSPPALTDENNRSNRLAASNI